MSPWSSKPTDIASNYGLDKVYSSGARISLLYSCTGAERRTVEWQQLGALLHNCMIETVLTEIAQAERLLPSIQPSPIEAGRPRPRFGGSISNLRISNFKQPREEDFGKPNVLPAYWTL
ncbi:MAG: hypothetical protein ACR5K7_05780 [Symbiopectobacterium sp.]